jgi:hypothetical protein
MNIAAVATEEASVIRPVSKRGTRLSFLGGKKKEPELPAEPEETAGDIETASSHSRSLSHTQSKDHRHSFFRTQSREDKHPMSPGGFSSRGSFEQIGFGDDKAVETKIGSGGGGGGGGSLGKKNSVRKRFSMLKIGRKSSKGNGMMGSLDEE